MPQYLSSRRKEKQRGFVLVTMALAAVALVGVLGLSVDIGRMFIAKSETQIYCDSAALAAALALNGTTTGITNAQTAYANSSNTWNFNTTAVSNSTLTFATTTAGPWLTTPNPAAGYIYAKVTATAPLPLYFLAIFVSQTSQNVVSSATAGQVPITAFPRGLAPYTAVSTNTTGPNYGFTVGNSYDIQWPQYNGKKNGCGPGNPDKCFNSPPCSGETKASEVAVISNWGANISGYWGDSSNSVIDKEILNVVQLQSLDVGTNIYPVLSNGTKASEAGYLDQRASQDINGTDNTPSAYFANSHNSRRVLPVPIVNPLNPTHTNVIGYAEFLLLTNGSPSTYYANNTTGSDPFCAIYVGSYVVGGSGPGAGGSTGASVVKLVQ